MTQYTTVDRVIASFQRDVKSIKDVPEYDIVEWIGEALDFMGIYQQLESKVVNLEVKDFKVLLPNGIQKIVQAAYKFTKGKPESNPVSCSDPETTNTTEEETTTAYPNTITPVKFVTRDRIADYYAAYYFKVDNNYYQNHYLPLRLASSTFGIKHYLHCEGNYSLHPSMCGEEQYIIDGPYMKTSFKEGYVSLAYLSVPLDERGYPKVIDNSVLIEAVKRYIIMKSMFTDFLNGSLNPNIYAKLEDDWHWYCKQAKTRFRMNDTIDEMENYKQMTKRILPKEQRYYNFFGALNRQENLNLHGRGHASTGSYAGFA